MTPTTHSAPRTDIDPQDPTRLRLSGDWTLEHADAIAAALRETDENVGRIDAREVRRLDSLGVLQLLRYATRRGLADDALEFNGDHAALVQAIDDVRDERPKTKREYGVLAALERLGHAMHENGREIVALVSFLGETLVKLLRLLRNPGRLRPVSVVYHMEQVGLDAVPLVALLSFLIGAVIA
ncbi:MAG: ABC transporter permease, partial [Xanthomonadaceae bacterium]|nr:ABC transporter permease [Xanthomonadaceae bacterium]